MRSLLFVPGDSPRKFAKALGTEADTLILDLEDSVALNAKISARASVREMLAEARQGKTVLVRVNAYDTGLTLDDLAAVMPLAPDAIMLPKCSGAEDVALLGAHLSAFEAASGLAQGGTGILPIATETGEAVLGLSSYRPDPRLIGLMWGAEDLIASIGAVENRSAGAFTGPFALARSLLLMAASKAGVPAIDTPCTVIGDLSVVEAEARAARRDGFAAKAVIHPAHAAAVNAAFQPTEGEIAWAQRIVAAFDAAPGLGVVQIEGKMIDKPHEKAARRLLAGAKPA